MLESEKAFGGLGWGVTNVLLALLSLAPALPVPEPRRWGCKARRNCSPPFAALALPSPPALSANGVSLAFSQPAIPGESTAQETSLTHILAKPISPSPPSVPGLAGEDMINSKGRWEGRKKRPDPTVLSHPAGQALSFPGRQEGLSEMVGNSKLDVHAQGCM